MKHVTKIIFVSIFTLLMNSLSFAATLQSLSKQQFERAFVNKTATSVGTIQSNGTPLHIPFSMFLDNHGRIWATLAAQPANNMPQTDEGVYTVGKDGSLYITWNHWFHSKRLCAHLFNTKNGYIVVGCDNVFQTIFMKNAIVSGKTF